MRWMRSGTLQLLECAIKTYIYNTTWSMPQGRYESTVEDTSRHEQWYSFDLFISPIKEAILYTLRIHGATLSISLIPDTHYLNADEGTSTYCKYSIADQNTADCWSSLWLLCPQVLIVRWKKRASYKTRYWGSENSGLPTKLHRTKHSSDVLGPRICETTGIYTVDKQGKLYPK